MNWLRIRKLEFLLPIFLFCWGMFFTFRYFWQDSNVISGDLGDARFNAVVLEHTWLWLKGVHASLFNLPIYFPHPNVYAFSDFLMGTAPFYWLARFAGLESLLSLQVWTLACASFNYLLFYVFAKKYFQFAPALAGFAAYFFSFAVPRTAQLGHPQLIPQFYIIIAAMGAFAWWKNPKSKLALFLFFLGSALQLLTAFYFFWFWIWTAAIYAIYVLCSSIRRQDFAVWLKQINPKFTATFAIFSAILIAPFVIHYLHTAKELGMRGWVSITMGLPRIYSWTALPPDHWEWPFTPFTRLLKQLPESIWVEHYLSFGMVSWIVAIAALVFVFKKEEQRYLTLPILCMFVLTFCIGRISLWVTMVYLFPGGGAIRAASRIQIYMLLFWAITIGIYGKALWEKYSSTLTRILLLGLATFLILENTYTGTLSHLSFSRSEENARIQKIVKKIPADCEVFYYTGTPQKSLDWYELDAMRAAFESGRSTINGYSGSQPKVYVSIFSNSILSSSEKLAQWVTLHPELSQSKLCQVDYVD
jgi:hypothetical protein